MPNLQNEAVGDLVCKRVETEQVGVQREETLDSLFVFVIQVGHPFMLCRYIKVIMPPVVVMQDCQEWYDV